MTELCNDPACGHDQPHLHDPSAPRRVGMDDAQQIDSGRRLLMSSFGEPIEPGPIPEMTVRVIDAPVGMRPMEIAQVTASFANDAPPVRGRFAEHLRATIGLPGMRIQKDEAKEFWTWGAGVRSRLDFAAVIAAWRTIASFEGVTYLRIEGIDRDGLWILDTDPEGPGPRFSVVGPERD